MSSPAVTIGLLWHSMNSDNLGVGALTLGNMAIAEEAARNAGLEPHFKVLGWDDPKPPYYSRSNIEVIGLRAKDLNPLGGKLAKVAKECDLVLDIGAGDSFADIYGPGPHRENVDGVKHHSQCRHSADYVAANHRPFPKRCDQTRGAEHHAAGKTCRIARSSLNNVCPGHGF